MNDQERDLLAEVIKAQRVTIAALAVLLSHQKDQGAIEQALRHWLPKMVTGGPSDQRPPATMPLAEQMAAVLWSATGGAYRHPQP